MEELIWGLLWAGHHPGGGGHGPPPWPRLSLWGGVTWLLGPSAPQSAGGVMVAWTDESFAQNRAERGL